MRTTIDRAGRVVIPAAIRRRAGLTAGCELEITLDEGGVQLRRVVSPPRLVRERGRLVVRPQMLRPDRDQRNTWSIALPDGMDSVGIISGEARRFRDPRAGVDLSEQSAARWPRQWRPE